MENIYAERIAALRQMMARKGWDAVVISGSDPHASEYPSPRWKQVEWLTGFTCEIALWSCRLAFTHPFTGEKMEFELEPPQVYPWTVC